MLGLIDNKYSKFKPNDWQIEVQSPAGSTPVTWLHEMTEFAFSRLPVCESKEEDFVNLNKLLVLV